MKTLSG